MLLQLTLTKDEHPIPATGCCIYRSGGSGWRLQTQTALALATQAGDRTAFGLYWREAGTDISQLFGLLIRIGTLRCFAGLSLLNTQTFLRKAVSAKGRISNIFEVIPAGDCVFPSRIVTVQFWTEQEESIAFQSPTFQGNPETVVGSIRVLYDPNRPAEAKIRSFEGLWLTSGLRMFLGAGFSLLFTGLFVSVLR